MIRFIDIVSDINRINIFEQCFCAITYLNSTFESCNKPMRLQMMIRGVKHYKLQIPVFFYKATQDLAEVVDNFFVAYPELVTVFIAEPAVTPLSS